MSSIVRDHSDDVQLFIDSLGVKGEYRRTLKKAVVKTVLGQKSFLYLHRAGFSEHLLRGSV